ncbi:phosphotransferase family protein [Arthrobacter sp. W4I7]|uniref:phosphotransferase family protein n=1 Tax=Arthrobacter sp. W4I7 TaxID=3042296 RepID=UPI00277E1534|nr:phosphotransferase family protein [Arthrobacter sp. W4I7]MDQ0691380.1 aminoglycoside phosphotransferase (APT) family kinase protein [Arthrobacter sp. W4I7]
MNASAVLNAWIGERLPGHGEPLTLRPIGAATGAANELSWMERGEHTWVLRRAPNIRVTASANNMLREWRILTALDRTDVPHPTPLLVAGSEESPFGTPFIVLEKVDGFTPVGVLPAPYDTANGRRNLAFAMVDALALLAQVDCNVPELQGLGRPEGFLERQVDRWLGQWSSYRTRGLPVADELAVWLGERIPGHWPVGLMHGDYSAFNVMASPTQTTRLAAVIDWDTGTVGCPLLDIGHLLARWTEPGEDPVVVNWDIGDGSLASRSGLPSRAELAERYVQQSGLNLEDLVFFEVLSLFKLALILEGRVAQAASPEEGSGWVQMVDRLLLGALEFARGERI